MNSLESVEEQTTAMQMRMQMMLARSTRLQNELAANLDDQYSVLASTDADAGVRMTALRADRDALMRMQKSIQAEMVSLTAALDERLKERQRRQLQQELQQQG